MQSTANVEMTKKYNVLCSILSGLPEVANILFCGPSSDTSISTSWSVRVCRNCGHQRLQTKGDLTLDQQWSSEK